MLLNNRYQILQSLSSGGFGETFVAEDTQMPSKRRCLIKKLHPVNNDPKISQITSDRFHREATILEDLGNGSDQIPSLYAYFEENGEFYLVQELIEGKPLSEILQKQGSFSEAYVKEFLFNLLPVLEYVHSKKIVHRDINPDNIIIRSHDSKPVLIDFGAVKESMGTTITTSGNVTGSIMIGTPGFMPSEQAAGRPVYSSDLYAVGLTAILMLTGKQPQEIETDHRTGEILWKQYALTTSPTLASILDKAIYPHARERYTTAQEMLEALLREKLRTVVVSPGGIDPPQPPEPPSRIDSLQTTLILGTFLAIAVVAGFWITRENSSPTIVSSSSPSPSSTPLLSPSPPPSPSPSPSPPSSPSPPPNPSPSPSPPTSTPTTSRPHSNSSPPPNNSSLSPLKVNPEGLNDQDLDQLSTIRNCVPPKPFEYVSGSFGVSWTIATFRHEGLLIMEGRIGKMRISYFDQEANQTITVDQTMVVASCTQGLAVLGYDPVYAGTNRKHPNYAADNLIIRRETNGNVTMFVSDDQGVTAPVEIQELSSPNNGNGL